MSRRRDLIPKRSQGDHATRRSLLCLSSHFTQRRRPLIRSVHITETITQCQWQQAASDHVTETITLFAAIAKFNDHVTETITQFAAKRSPLALAVLVGLGQPQHDWHGKDVIHLPGYPQWPHLLWRVHLPALLRNEEVDPRIDILVAALPPLCSRETPLGQPEKLL